MFIVVGDRRVIVSRDARYPPLAHDVHDLVRPRRITYEIPEVVHSPNIIPTVNIRENRFEGREVRVDV
jgi:hypothetical protein